MSDESMTDVSYCECMFRFPKQGAHGLYCGYCLRPILTQDSKDEAEPLMNDDDIYADTVTVDRALLVRLARLVSEMRLVELMDYGTTDDARALRERCEQILREHGDG